MDDFSMSNINGCFVTIAGAVAQHLKIGNFVPQFNAGQPARLGEGRSVYWFRGWTNCGAKISADVSEYCIADNLGVKIISAVLTFSWRNDWRKEGGFQHVKVKCEYVFPERESAFPGGGYKVTRL